jgi:hypothetical protein
LVDLEAYLAGRFLSIMPLLGQVLLVVRRESDEGIVQVDHSESWEYAKFDFQHTRFFFFFFFFLFFWLKQRKLIGIDETPCAWSPVEFTTEAQLYHSTSPVSYLISLDPPRSSGKQSAISIDHVNQCFKLHAKIPGKKFPSWSGVEYPRLNNLKLFYAMGEGTTSAGNTHIVAVGGHCNHMTTVKKVEVALVEVEGLFSLENNTSKTPEVERLHSFPQPVKGRVRQRSVILHSASTSGQPSRENASSAWHHFARKVGLGCRMAKLHRWCR